MGNLGTKWIQWLRELKMHRSRVFWLFVVLLVITLVTGGYQASVFIPPLLRQVGGSLPSWNTNLEIMLELEKPAVGQESQNMSSQQDKLHREIQDNLHIGTPVYRLNPNLELVGFVAKVSEHRDFYYLQIKKEYDVVVLREDTTFEFLGASPSLLAVLSRFVAQNQKQLLPEITALARENQQLVEKIGNQLHAMLASNVNNSALVAQLWEDKTLSQAMGRALKREILGKIPWNQVLENLERDDQTGQLVALYKNSIHWKGIFTGSMEASLDGAIDEMSSFLIDPKYVSSRRSGPFIKWMSSMFYAVTHPHDFLGTALRGARQAAGKKSWELTLYELKQVYRQHEDEILKHGSDLLKKSAVEMQLQDKTVNFVQSLREELGPYIQERYGKNAWDTLDKTLQEAKGHPQLRENIDCIGQKTLEFLKKWTEKFLLDDKKTGPNPLLLLAFREGITQKAETQLICFAGAGQRVEAKSHIFKLNPLGKK